jgi:hypothetical protein
MSEGASPTPTFIPSCPRSAHLPAHAVTGLKVRFWSPLRIALCLRSQLFCYFPTICTVGGLP